MYLVVLILFVNVIQLILNEKLSQNVTNLTQKYNHDIFNYRCQYSIHNLRKIAYISYREYSKINILSRACMRDLFIIQ